MPGQMIVEQIPQGTMGILAGSLVPGTHIDVQKQRDKNLCPQLFIIEECPLFHSILSIHFYSALYE